MDHPALRAWLALLDLVWPPRCAVCDGPAWTGEVLCAICAARIGPPTDRCRRCGRSVGPYQVTSPCAACADEDLRLDGVLVAWPYADVARALVLALKSRGRLEVAPLLARALVEVVRAADVPGDLVVPVPLSGRRGRERGFNQSARIARPLARDLGLACSTRALRRIRHAPPQTGGTLARRRRQPRGAFRARRAIVAGRSVLLVDDVLTSGSTARASAVALRRAGARSVVAVVCCRAARGGAFPLARASILGEAGTP